MIDTSSLDGIGFLSCIESRALGTMEPESFVRLSKARVVLADYGELLRCFPSLRTQSCQRSCSAPSGNLSSVNYDALDRWLISNAAIMSQSQLTQPHLNTPIQQQDTTTIGYRGTRMGRSCIIPVESDASYGPDNCMRPALDVKGCGIRRDANGFSCEYRNGLLDLDKALEDYLKERLVARVMSSAKAGFRVVKTLAILDCGFQITDTNGVRGPAGLCVRQAASRPDESDLPSYGSVEHRFSFEAELVLRKYGITTCDSKLSIKDEGKGARVLADGSDIYSHYPDEFLLALIRTQGIQIPFSADRINVQAAKMDAPSRDRFRLVDFGHYSVRKEFTDPILSLVSNRPYCWGGLLSVKSDHFCQPNVDISDDWIETRVGADSDQPRGIVYDGFVTPVGREFARTAARETRSAEQLRLLAEDLIDETTALPRCAPPPD